MYVQIGIISILMLTLGAQLFLRSFLVAHIKKIFWGSVALMTGYLGYVSWMQYSVWKNNPATAMLLPPHEPLSYFIQYVGMHVWSVYIISFLGALLFYYAFGAINKSFGGKFLYPGELWVGSLALFLVGYPGIIFYIPVFLVVFVVVSIIRLVFYGKGERTSPYILWLPVAVCVILASIWYLSALSWWNALII